MPKNILIKVEVAYSFSAFSLWWFRDSHRNQIQKSQVSEYSEFEYDDVLRLIKKSNYFINSGNPQLTSYQMYDYEYEKMVKISTFNPQGS